MIRAMKLSKVTLFVLGVAAIAAIGYTLSKKKSNKSSESDNN